MAKISEEAKNKYLERITPYQRIIKKLSDKETKIEAMIADGDTEKAYKLLDLATDNLTSISLFIIMNSLSLALLGLRNEVALNNARKTCYKALIHLEKVYTNSMDVPFSEYRDALESTKLISEFQRYALIRKTGLSIALVRDGFGEHDRWKWSLVELEGRLATVAKNTLNLRTLIVGMDPRAEKYQERIGYFNLICKLLQQSADDYRKKYEVSTERLDDFRIAINYLLVLRRLSLSLGRQHESFELKRKIDIWREKMENDDKNKEKKQLLRLRDEIGKSTGENIKNPL